MRTRIITSVVALAIFIPFLVFSGDPSFVFVTATSILSLVAVYEVTKCTGLFKRPFLCILPYTAAVCINIMARYIRDTGRFFTLFFFYFFFLGFFLFLFLFIRFFGCIFCHWCCFSCRCCLCYRCCFCYRCRLCHMYYFCFRCFLHFSAAPGTKLCCF